MPPTERGRSYRKPVKMVPHGPGGQMLRPAPKPRPKVRYVPHSPGGQRLRPAPKVRVTPRTPQAKAHGRKVVRQSAQRVQKKEARQHARNYITENPIKGMQRSESRAVQAFSNLRASNPKLYDKNIAMAPLRKPDPLDVAAKGVTKGIKIGAKGVAGELGKLHGSQGNLAAISLPQSLAVKNSGASKQIGRAIENTGREATNIPANIIPTAAHILKPSYQHPFSPKATTESVKRLGEATISLPKAYVKAYEKHGLKGVENTFVHYPLSTALTVSPIIRGPGLLAGKVATRLGKMPRVAASELPGTAMRVVRPTSRSYFVARRAQKRAQKRGVKEVTNKDIQHRVDAEVALQEDLTRRAQAETHKKVYKDRKKVVGKKTARQEASQLATEAQNAKRLEQQRNSLERLALIKEPRAVASGRDVKKTLKEARAKEKAARKSLTKLPWVQGQLLRNTGHTIADWTKLEDDETRLFTLAEHHKAAAEQERAIGNEALAKQHDRMAETANKQLTPIEGELEKLTRAMTPRDLGGAQLEADLKHSDYMNARRERQAIESNPSNLRMVDPGGDAQVFPEATQAINAAERYNADHPVKMVPKKVSGGYLVVPKSALERFKAHEANTDIGPGSAIVKAYNNIWRKTALATHFTWPTGNIGEAALRSAVEKVGPTSYIRGYKFGAEMKRVDPKAYEEMVAHTTKGGHMAMQVHVPDETRMNITGYGPFADFVRHVQKMRDKPVIRNVANGWDAYTKLVMDHLSGKAESFFQTGMLGKELSRSPLMDGHILKTSKAAIRDAVNGGRETHNMVALGEAVDRMYGQYGKFDPFTRKMIARYTPFIAWTLNSLKWLYWYLPKDHPVLTATAASVQPYVEHWLKDKGLSAFVKGALPSFLQGSIPTKGEGHARYPTRYTPFAVAAGEPEDLAGALLPQLSGVQGAMQHGINWKGQSLRNPDGTPLDPHQKEIYAALTILGGGIPGLQLAIDPATNYEKGARLDKRLIKFKSGKDMLKSENPLSIVPKKKVKKAKSPFDGPSQSKSPFDAPSTKEKSPFD